MSHEMFKTSVNPAIQEMLRSTIKLMCQNSIEFGVQLTIQGLLGITVDGSEVLLVNVQEHINKSNDDNMTVSTTSIVQRTITNVPLKKNTSTQRNAAWSGTPARPVKQETYDCEILSDSGISQQPERFRVKEECGYENAPDEFGEFDENYAEDDGEYNEYANEEQEYNETTGAEYYEEGEEYYEPTENDGSGYDQQQSSTSFTQTFTTSKRKRATNPTRVAPRQRQKSKPAVLGASYNESFVEDQKGFMGSNEAEGSGGKKSSAVLASERHQVFTCSICGQSMSLLSSFIRHKKIHDGTVYRCLCGKVVSRRDGLVAHKRKCDVWQEKQHLLDQ